MTPELANALEGRDGAPVLVLSGSLGTTMRLWEPQLEAFVERFRLLRHDHPGHGRSPLSEGAVTVERIGRDVLASTERLGVERFSFCGLSLGGMVGMWLAANAPDRVESLTLCCTGPKLGTPDDWAERARLVREAGTGAVVARSRERWFTSGFRDTAVARGYLAELEAMSREGYASCCDAVGAFDFRDEVGRIRAPTLLVLGAEDPVTPPDVVAPLQRGVPALETLVVEGAAHLASVERPEAVTDAVLRHAYARATA